ncbi:MAG: VOC family protein [Oscillospiraceae bacterium]|jgi:catechol 2,3-dioxygenase-like lactoylglutathione lyase family enzyme|nr:VOC family protein [Oscillospiraceae bacterium]
MTITHTAIYTLDLERLREFYCKWFGGSAEPEYQNSEQGFSSCVLRFGSGAALKLMHSHKLKETVRREFSAGFAHLAFSTESEESVENLTRQMRADGVPVISGPSKAGGSYESCVLDPDGNRVKITAEQAVHER